MMKTFDWFFPWQQFKKSLKRKMRKNFGWQMSFLSMEKNSSNFLFAFYQRRWNNTIFYTHSALLNLFSNFPTSPVWGWHTPYFPGNSASNSLNLKVEERGVNETQPLPHTPFPVPIITSSSQILHKLMYWSYTINEDLDQITKHFFNYNYVFKYFRKG